MIYDIKYINCINDLKQYSEIWNEIKEQIKLISGEDVIEIESEQIFKARFNTTDDLPLHKIIAYSFIVIVINSVLKENGKYYLQVLLFDCYYEHKKV